MTAQGGEDTCTRAGAEAEADDAHVVGLLWYIQYFACLCRLPLPISTTLRVSNCHQAGQHGYSSDVTSDRDRNRTPRSPSHLRSTQGPDEWDATCRRGRCRAGQGRAGQRKHGQHVDHPGPAAPRPAWIDDDTRLCLLAGPPSITPAALSFVTTVVVRAFGRFPPPTEFVPPRAGAPRQNV